MSQDVLTKSAYRKICVPPIPGHVTGQDAFCIACPRALNGVDTRTGLVKGAPAEITPAICTARRAIWWLCTVTVRVGQDPPQAAGRLKMVVPEEPLTRGVDGLYRAPGGDLPASPTARLQDGALEQSNVNPVETMVGIIAASRQYEQQWKMVQSAQDDDKAASRLLSNNA